MANILLVGSTGFIGKNLAAHLSAAGHRVVVQARSEAVMEGFQSVTCDLEETSKLNEVMQHGAVDTVLHLACGLIPSSGQAAFLEEMQKVVQPTFRFIERVAELGKTFVFFSSAGALYGASDKEALSEAEPVEPISYYGYSKLVVEQYMQMAARTLGLRYLILRPSNPYGRHQRGDGKQGFIGAALRRLISGEPLEIWGDGSIVRDYVLIDDLCVAIDHVLRSGLINEALNIGSGTGHSLNQVVELLQKVSGRAVEVRYMPGRSVDRPRIVLDTAKSRSLGVPEATSLERGLALVWDEARRAGR